MRSSVLQRERDSRAHAAVSGGSAADWQLLSLFEHNRRAKNKQQIKRRPKVIMRVFN